MIQERRLDLLTRARKRFSTYAARKYNALSKEGTFGPCLQLSVGPRFPARPLCEQGALNKLISKNLLPWRGTSFPQWSNGPFSQHESAVLLEAAEGLSFFEANIWGMFSYGMKIDLEGGLEARIHLYHLAGCVLAGIRHSSGMLDAMGYSVPVIVDVALTSILGVPLAYAAPTNNYIQTRRGSELDDDALFLIAITAEALREQYDTVAAEVLRSVLFSLNAAELTKAIPNLIRKGYDFNS